MFSKGLTKLLKWIVIQTSSLDLLSNLYPLKNGKKEPIGDLEKVSWGKKYHLVLEDL